MYPWLLGSVGRGVVFGQGVVLRHPGKIRIGDGVTIDDLVVLDAKGTSNRGIDIGDGVFLGRSTILSCKDGDIVLGDHTNLGFHCEVFSGSTVTVGRHGLFAAYVYLVGGGHEFERGGPGGDRSAPRLGRASPSGTTCGWAPGPRSSTGYASATTWSSAPTAWSPPTSPTAPSPPASPRAFSALAREPSES